MEDYPKLEDIFLEVHAARMTIRDYEARLDRVENEAVETFRRRFRNNAKRATDPKETATDCGKQSAA